MNQQPFVVRCIVYQGYQHEDTIVSTLRRDGEVLRFRDQDAAYEEIFSRRRDGYNFRYWVEQEKS